jgi:hypothetical protein
MSLHSSSVTRPGSNELEPIAPKKYDGINQFLADKPPQIPRDIIAMAFHVIDQDKDELISKQDMIDTIAKHKHIKITDAVAEAMYLDASATRFSLPTGVTPKPGDETKDKLNIDDVQAACGFRKRSHDKKWIPRRLRNEWIGLLRDLLPEKERESMYAPVPSQLFTPPALTGRERDTLNVSPIGFVSSRPSSPGNSTTLSGYFSTLTTTNAARQSLGSRNGSRGMSGGGNHSRGTTPNLLQRPRFVPHPVHGGSAGFAQPETVKSISLKKRPRSRADGRVHGPSKLDDDTSSLVNDVVRSTTPAATFSSMRSMSMGSLRPSTTQSMMSPMQVSAPSSANMFASPASSPVPMRMFDSSSSDFSGTQSPQMLGSDVSRPHSVMDFKGQSMHKHLRGSLMNKSSLTDQIAAGRKQIMNQKKKSLMPVVKPQYDCVQGTATVSRQWHRFLVDGAKSTLEDNKGWNMRNRDAHEKRLIAEDAELREYLRQEDKKDMSAFFRGTGIQEEKNQTCVWQDGFFGKSNQGTFRVDEEKPYSHVFRDYQTTPIFYN